jgi:hypothetical protein
MKRGAAFVTLLAVLVTCGCGPAAAPSCANDAECRQIDEALHYCVQNRCVECVTKAACGRGRTCSVGRCIDR